MARLQAAVCLFTDLTAVVELEEQLRLKEALARLGELTAGLAHEFRNGLATIHGYGRLLDPATLPDQARTCVDGIRAETTALGEVVTNFLRFARPEQMTMAPVDLRAVIARAIEDVPGAAAAVVLEGNFGDRSMATMCCCGGRSATWFATASRRARTPACPPQVYVRSDVTADDAQLVFEDNGPGFAPESSREGLPAVRDDEGERHRPWPCDRAEGDRVAQRPHHRRQPPGRRRAVSHPAADRAALVGIAASGGRAACQELIAARLVPICLTAETRHKSATSPRSRSRQRRCSEAGMSSLASARGFTLLETLVATGILVTALAGVAQLFVLGAHLTRQAGASGMALVAAQDKLESLRGQAFTYDAAGAAVTAAALAAVAVVEPRGRCRTLRRLAGSGRSGRTTNPEEAVLVRRWRISSLGDHDA